MSFKQFGTLVESESSAPKFKQFGEVVETPQEDNRGFWDKTIQNFGEANLMQLQSGGYAGAPNLTPSQGANVAADVGTIAATEALFAPIIAKAGASKVLPGTLQNIARLTEAGTMGTALQTVHSLLEKGEIPSKDEMIKAGLTTAAIDAILRGSISATQALKNLPKLTKETLPSGLTKPRAIEAKHPRLGTLSKERQGAVIEKLNKEASNLSKKSLETHVPISKQLEEGVDFEGKFNKGFGDIEKMAEKANPAIEITPISKLMTDTRKKYRGIPELHPDAKKIMNEAKAFSKRPPEDLHTALKVYRSNNQKKRQIYETAHLTGRQREYVKFLDDYNRAIADSFKKSLPEDSAWLKMFTDLNKEYKNVQDARKTMYQLRGILSEKPTPAQINRLATDTQVQKRLSLSMGEQGAKEITQIAKDLKRAVDAIKKIPVRELSKFDHAFPLYFFIPWIGKALGLAKGIKFARYGYGWLLSTPARRAHLDKSIKALSAGNLKEYTHETNELKKELGIKERTAKQFEKAKMGNFENIEEKGKQTLEKTIESNPEFKGIQNLKEPTQYLRKQDITKLNKISPKTKYNYQKEWKKYFPEDKYNKYYNRNGDTDFYIGKYGIRTGLEMGKFGDLIKDPKLKKHFEEIKDIPVIRVDISPARGKHTSLYNKPTKEMLEQKIFIDEGLSPQGLHSTLMHEGTHALQGIRKSKKTGNPRLIDRHIEPKSFKEYLENLNEVKARQFQNWVNKDVNKYRSTLEKTKVAKKLWEQQQKEGKAESKSIRERVSL